MQKALNGLPIVLVGIAVVIGVSFAFYRLSEAPGIWYDEGFYTQVAMNFAERGAEGLQVAPGEFISAKDVTVGYPLLAPVALSYKLFGVGVLSGRVVMALFIIAFLAAAYAFARMLYGPRLAAWSVLLLATFPQLYGNGKSVLGEVPGMLFVLLALCSVFYLERSAYKKIFPYIALGLTTGLAVATKPIFILLPVALVITFIIRRRHITVHLVGVAWGAAAFLAIVGVWIYLQFGTGDSLSFVLNYYLNPYDVSIGTTLVQNLRLFVTEAVPTYVAGLFALWGLSIGIRKRAGQFVPTAEIAALVFGLCVIAAFLRLPGWYRYFFPAALIAMLPLPYAAVSIFAALSARLRLLGKIAWLPYAALALLCLVQLYALIGHSYVAQYYGGHRTRDLTAYIATLPKDASYFIYNSPEVAVLLPSRNYYQFLIPHPNQLIGQDQLPVLARGGADFVIIGTEAYHRDAALFGAYAERANVNRFTFLQKK